MGRRMIIGIAGKKESGKNALCSFLQEIHPSFEETKFAGALWKCLLAADPWVDAWQKEDIGVVGFERLSVLNRDYGYEYCKKHFPEVRRLMKELGTAGIRENVGRHTWVNVVQQQLVSHPDQDFVVTDLRFREEGAMIHAFGGMVVKLERDNDDGDTHISEAIAGIFEDHLYVNNSGLDDLREFAQRLVEEY